MREILGPAEQAARDTLEAEEALRLVRQRFEHTRDPELRGELAVEALDQVERQLELTRERRRRVAKLRDLLKQLNTSTAQTA